MRTVTDDIKRQVQELIGISPVLDRRPPVCQCSHDLVGHSGQFPVAGPLDDHRKSGAEPVRLLDARITVRRSPAGLIDRSTIQM